MNIYQLLLAYHHHYRRLPANCCGYAFNYIYIYIHFVRGIRIIQMLLGCLTSNQSDIKYQSHVSCLRLVIRPNQKYSLRSHQKWSSGHKSKSYCLETKSLDHPWIIRQYWLQSLRKSKCLQSRSLLVVALNIQNGILHCHINNARDGWDLQFHFCFTIDFDTYMISHHSHPLVGVHDFMYILQHSADHRTSIFRM